MKIKLKRELTDKLRIPMIINNNLILFPKTWSWQRRVIFIYHRTIHKIKYNKLLELESMKEFMRLLRTP